MSDRIVYTGDNLDDMIKFVGIRLVTDVHDQLFVHGRGGFQLLKVGDTVVEFDDGRFRVEAKCDDS